jgi:hypothetical protein
MSYRPDQPTRVRPPAPALPPPARSSSDLDLKTLVITAAASALAAFICSKVWAPGTLASAAFTPVAVALFREALRKPTEVVTSALPAALPITRRGASADAAYGAGGYPVTDDDPTRVRGPLSSDDPTRVHQVVPPGEQPTQVSSAFGPGAPGPTGLEPVSVHAVARRNRRRWQIAIGTGLLGFVIAALLITVPEVVAGKDDTTIFHGGRSTPTKTEKAPPATTTTVVQQVTTAPAETVTQTTEAEPTTTTTETQTVTEEAAPTTTVTTTATTPTTTPDEPVDPDAVDP